MANREWRLNRQSGNGVRHHRRARVDILDLSRVFLLAAHSKLLPTAWLQIEFLPLARKGAEIGFNVMLHAYS